MTVDVKYFHMQIFSNTTTSSLGNVCISQASTVAHEHKAEGFLEVTCVFKHQPEKVQFLNHNYLVDMTTSIIQQIW